VLQQAGSAGLPGPLFYLETHRQLRKRELGNAMQCARQDVVDMLRRVGLPELAEEALRVLPDPVDLDFAARVLQAYGITKDELIDRMGGSP
jgi:hypothetical protein